jgi:hypothetical protein
MAYLLTYPPRCRRWSKKNLAQEKTWLKKKLAQEKTCSRKDLPRRANHLHMFTIARIKPAPGNRSRAF